MEMYIYLRVVSSRSLYLLPYTIHQNKLLMHKTEKKKKHLSPRKSIYEYPLTGYCLNLKKALVLVILILHFLSF